MFEWLFKKDDSTTIDVLEVIARDLTKVQLAAMAQEKAAGMIAKAIAKSEIVLTRGDERRKDRRGRISGIAWFAIWLRRAIPLLSGCRTGSITARTAIAWTNT